MKTKERVKENEEKGKKKRFGEILKKNLRRHRIKSKKSFYVKWNMDDFNADKKFKREWIKKKYDRKYDSKNSEKTLKELKGLKGIQNYISLSKSMKEW